MKVGGGDMFKTIIAAVDGSERSWQALKCAQNLAVQYTAKLIMVHAYPHTSDLHDFDGYQKLLTRRKDAGEQILKTGRQIIEGSGLDLEFDLLEGPAADAILSAAEARKVDLIVMGTRGMGAIKGLLFGSIATKVSHYAPCSVLVVR
jgi:nucleotide-binding universal stress UspA family protein